MDGDATLARGIYKKNLLIIHHTIIYDALIPYMNSQGGKFEEFKEDLSKCASAQHILRTLMEVHINNPGHLEDMVTTSQKTIDHFKQDLENANTPVSNAYDIIKLIEKIITPNKEDHIYKQKLDEGIISMAVEAYETKNRKPVIILSEATQNNFVEDTVQFYKKDKRPHFKKNDIPFNIYTPSQTQAYILQPLFPIDYNCAMNKMNLALRRYM